MTSKLRIMMNTILQLKQLLTSFITLLLMLIALPSHAAAVAEESELKAAFVYNFTLFTTWPQSNHFLRICVLGENTYLPLLKVYDGRMVGAATIQVAAVQSANEAHTCQVLFVGKSMQEKLANISHTLEGAPVLIVTEFGGIQAELAHISLMNNNGRMVFEINQKAASAAGLNLSYKLLKLARKVR